MYSRIQKLKNETNYVQIIHYQLKNKQLSEMNALDTYSFNLIFQLLDFESQYKIIKNFRQYECLKENIHSITCTKNTTDNILLKFKNLTSLNCSYCKNITDIGIKELKNLTSLKCFDCENITDAGIKELINLISLNCSWCRNITDDGIKELKNLTSLIRSWCEGVTDEGIKELKNLTIMIF